jgi:hypothetical protein
MFGVKCHNFVKMSGGMELTACIINLKSKER